MPNTGGLLYNPNLNRPVAGSLLLQQLQDGLSVHVQGRVQPGDVKDCGSQVNVEHQVRVSEGEPAAIKPPPKQPDNPS